MFYVRFAASIQPQFGMTAPYSWAGIRAERPELWIGWAAWTLVEMLVLRCAVR